MKLDTNSATTAALFSAYREILRELKSRTVIRTGNAPTGDYAEWLVARYLGGDLAPNSEKSFDVTDQTGNTFQVKSRMVDGKGASKRQLSPFRSWDFTTAAIILFDDDYTVMRASFIPVDIVRAAGTYRKHVNGDVVFARDDLLDLGRDVTAELRRVAGEVQ